MKSYRRQVSYGRKPKTVFLWWCGGGVGHTGNFLDSGYALDLDRVLVIQVYMFVKAQ